MSYYSSRNAGPPGWFVFLLGLTFIFGVYYLYAGFRDFLESGGQSITQATEQAEVLAATAAIEQEVYESRLPTRRPTSTPIPPCQEFVISVPSAIVRSLPTTNSDYVDSFSQGTTVCVMSRFQDSDWYLIDYEPVTRRVEEAYIREDLMRPANPTPTPTNTIEAIPAATITPTPTLTPTPS